MTNKIKEIRVLRGVKQIELASAAGISGPYLYDLENNRRGAKPETLERIAKALGVTVDDLIDMKDEQAVDRWRHRRALRSDPADCAEVRSPDGAHGETAPGDGGCAAGMGVCTHEAPG